MEQETENPRICKRCLLREMADQEEYFRSLKDYIENMDPDIRAAERLYEERLGICRECGMLLQGMCRKCGCYVELKAAVAKNACPWGKWDRSQ
ncbi:MAG: DUF6171 family protein [Blautia sp.]|nr:DUF6171 family protein [Blautia sp.]